MTGGAAQFAVDTSVIVAGLLSWHEHHSAARQCLDEWLASSEKLVVPAPALLEAYAVMTRLPAPHRLRPRDAYRLLFETFRERARVVALSERDLWKLLGSVSEQDVAGGRACDAQIVAAAVRGRATCVFTFNNRDFEPPARELVEVRNPLTDPVR